MVFLPSKEASDKAKGKLPGQLLQLSNGCTAIYLPLPQLQHQIQDVAK
jgi:hypothetical protein